MARFVANYEETFTVAAPPEVAKAHFTHVETIAANYGPLEAWDKIDDDTLHIRLKRQEFKGVSFVGEYTARYTHQGDGVVRWDTLERKNMRSAGQITFIPKGGGTEVTYKQTIEIEIEMGALLAKLAGPFVKMGVEGGVRDYLKRMRSAL